MAARSADDVKRELESQRELLGSAVAALRSQAERARRKLPLVAVAAAGGGLALRTVSRRLSRRRASG